MHILDGERRANSIRNRLTALAAALVAAPTALALSPASPPVNLELFDRTAGTTLEVHIKDGQRYVVGVPGHEYAIRIRNESPERVLAVTSVDGVNVVTGDTAAPEQSGYVIATGDSVEIAGWRRSLERTSAFYFTDLGDSYAARTGRPANAGVVGVAVFRERVSLARQPLREKIAADAAQAERADAPASPAAAPSSESDKQAAEPAASGNAVDSTARARVSKLGTGFGRDETSYAQRVRFDRASSEPAQTVAIRYDRRENLIAMGVLPAPRYAERAPDPFPGMRFVPAPR